MISVFSVINALLAYCLVMALLILVNRRTFFVNKCGASALLLISAASSIRLILPIEVPSAFVVACPWEFLGSFSRFFSAHPGVVRVMAVVWAIGAVVVLVSEVLRFRATCQECESYLVLEDERVQKIARRFNEKLRVLVSPDVEGPFVLGGFHPTVYLPADKMSDLEVELALAHEMQHIRNHDPWIKLAFVFAQAALWWFLPIHLFRRDLDDFLELRCDTRVMDRLGPVDKITYMFTLTGAGRNALEFQEAMAAHKSMAVKDQCSLERRLKFLESYARKPRRLNPVAAVLIVAVFLASYLVIFQPGLSPSMEDLQNDVRNFYEEQYDDPKNGDGKSSVFILKDADGRYQLIINYEFSRYLTEEEVASEQYQNIYIFEEGSGE